MNDNNSLIDHTRLQNSKLSFRKNTKPKPIYHYTSIGGLQGILTGKKLWFTNIKYMNDRDEIIAGIDCMAKEYGIDDAEKNRLQSAFLSHEMQTFVCCFSMDGDSLPMWNYYTKEANNQGYNIEFSDKRLVESILRDNPVLDGCSLTFGAVDYSKDNDSEYNKTITGEVVSSISSSLSRLLMPVSGDKQYIVNNNGNQSLIKSFEEKVEDVEKEKRFSNLPIYFYNGEKCSFDKDPSGEYLYFIKRDCFRQEKEYRIVISVPYSRLNKMKEKCNGGVYKFRASNGVLIPYIELNFNVDVVESITISPTVQSDLVETSMKDFIKYCNFNLQDFEGFINHSKVPVRF